MAKTYGIGLPLTNTINGYFIPITSIKQIVRSKILNLIQTRTYQRLMDSSQFGVEINEKVLFQQNVNANFNQLCIQIKNKILTYISQIDKCIVKAATDLQENIFYIKIDYQIRGDINQETIIYQITQKGEKAIYSEWQ